MPESAGQYNQRGLQSFWHMVPFRVAAKLWYTTIKEDDYYHP